VNEPTRRNAGFGEQGEGQTSNSSNCAESLVFAVNVHEVAESAWRESTILSRMGVRIATRRTFLSIDTGTTLSCVRAGKTEM
jgi:hypothetical protein